ncbi:type II toxin-antitoxin system VapC family toxin [Candidatus Palauibacter sp.]|uniref:type II toxin-antitoxin system VapC family toxin n=1 Tax=Candidatus Palauibacter sp. TaxID=3101350 RepID=UPI003AF25224
MAQPTGETALFVDTAGWMAMADAADPKHATSRRERDACLRRGGFLVSTDYVVDETLTLIRARLGLRAAAEWWAQIDASSRLRWEWIDPLRAEKARRWFFEWNDQDFSFTDCTSFVVMKELCIRRALTTDRHFSQAGFETLPGSDR